MLSKVKNVLNLKRRAKLARQLQAVDAQNDEALTNPGLKPEQVDQTLTSTGSQPLPVPDHPIVEQNDEALTNPSLNPEQVDQTLTPTGSQLLPLPDHPIVEQNDQTLTNPSLKPEPVDQTVISTGSQLLPVLDHPIVEQNDQTLSDSRLPPELERLIFQHAARGYRGTIPSLMRVASRVKQWVEPFLYEIIICKLSPYNPPDRRKMLTIRGNSVRHLFLRDGMSFASAWDYLHSCRNIRTISFFCDELGDNPMPPNDSSWSSFLSQCPNVFPVYQHLTHLELFTSSSPVRRIEWLASLPNLTYLFILSPMSDINSAVEPILARCLKIRVMLWCPWRRRFSDAGEPTKQQIQAINLGEPDPRLVVCKISYEKHTKHFIVHAEGKSNTKNMWELAEDIINERRETGTTNYADIVNVPHFTA